MQEYKQLNFVVVTQSQNHPSFNSIALDVFESEPCSIHHKGDVELIKKRWGMIKHMIDIYIEENTGA